LQKENIEIEEMKSEVEYFHCGDQLLRVLNCEIQKVMAIVDSIAWSNSFKYFKNGMIYEHQSGYNKAFAENFINRGRETQPILRSDPKLIGDFRKKLVFVEIQFGNSSALYRDYYKFQYGLANGLLSLAVLIVPSNPSSFFPNRARSVQTGLSEFEVEGSSNIL